LIVAGASAGLVVAIGELVVDWISTNKGGGFIESNTFVKSLGGNASNVAIALSRLGTRSRILAKVGNDIHGKYLTHVLSKEGVDTSFVFVDENAPTAQCYVFTTLDEDNTFLNWPPGNAAQRLTTGDVTDDRLAGATCIHTTGISLAHDPRRSAVLKTLQRAKELGVLVSFDAGFPTGEGKGSIHALETAVSIADVVKVNLLELFFWARHIGAEIKDSDLDFISAYENPPSSGHESKATASAPDLSQNRIGILAKSLFSSFNPKILLVTMAHHGSLVLTARSKTWGTAYEVQTLSGVGAGDAYVAGFLHALIESCGTDEIVKSLDKLTSEQLLYCNDFAGAVGALCTTHVSAYEGLPTRAEVEELMEQAVRAG
jgi:sugar/nucleoside kinase (ribokinase family)